MLYYLRSMFWIKHAAQPTLSRLHGLFPWLLLAGLGAPSSRWQFCPRISPLICSYGRFVPVIFRMEWLFKGADSVYETCWFITAASGIGGTVGGFGFGVFIGTLEGGHGSIHDASLQEQLRVGFKRTLKNSAKRGVMFAKQFGMVGIVYASIECALSKAMGRQDMYNALIAGALGGSMFALVPSISNYKNVVPSSVARGAIMGSVGWFAFTLVMELGFRNFIHASTYDVAWAKGGQASSLWRIPPWMARPLVSAPGASAAETLSPAAVRVMELGDSLGVQRPAELETEQRVKEGSAFSEAAQARGYTGVPGVSVDPPQYAPPSIWHRLVHGNPVSMNRASAIDGDGWVNKPF